MSFTGNSDRDALLRSVEEAGEASDDYEEATPSEYTDSDVEDVEEEESDDEDDGNNVPAPQTGTAARQRGAAGGGFDSILGGNPASVLTPFQNWQFQRPMATPLGFQVPSDGVGGVVTRTLVGTVDFNNGDSVAKANEHTRQRRERARKKHGLPPLRPSLLHRAINATQHAWLQNEYITYAAANGNRQIQNPELTRRFNAHFLENPPRTDLSISGYVSRKFKQVKESYIGRQRRR